MKEDEAGAGLGPGALRVDEAFGESLPRIRAAGNLFLETLLDAWSTTTQDPVHPPGNPSSDRISELAGIPPTGEDLATLLDTFRREILPGLTRVASPRYLGMMSPPPALPAVFATMLAAGLNQNCSLWNQSPAGVDLECALIGELCRLAGLGGPQAFGALVSGGSAANITALKLARTAALGEGLRERGLWGEARPVTVYASREAHYSFEKGMDFLGMGVRNLRLSPADGRFRAVPEALRRQMAQDRDQGMIPGGVIGIAGSTNTGSIDPLDELADVAQEFGAWFHVDAAYGGGALLVDGLRPRFAGIERADSVTLDPHKWFFVPFECAAILVRDRETLRSAFSTTPHYYMEQKHADSRHVDFYEYGLQGSRSFKALKLWFTFQSLGKAFYEKVIDRNLTFARRLAEALAGVAEWQVFNQPELGIVCFRRRPAALAGDEPGLDALNRRIHARMDQEGRFWISMTRLEGCGLALRVNFQNYRTREEDFAELVSTLNRLAEEEIR